MQSLDVLEFVNFCLNLRLWRHILFIPLFNSGSFWRHHGWLVGGFELTTRKHIHLLAHTGLDLLKLCLLDKLSERVDLLLVEQGDKVVAEPAHLAISMLEEFLDVPLITHLFLVIHFLQPLKLTWSLGKSPFSRLLFKNQHHEGTLFLAF